MKPAVYLLIGIVAAAMAARPHVVDIDMSSSSTLSFLTVGDWGGVGSSPYTTPAEIAAGVGMGRIASDLNASFVLALGDNFYESGVHGDATNFRFKDTFEDCYNEPSLQIPWYVLSGNHDHLGNVTAQIEYSQRSRRWRYPNLWYSLNFTFAGSRTLHIVMIDTVVLAGNNDLNEDRFSQPPGPADVALAESQWDFIENEISRSTADYLWVAGHYPVWSGCQHGPTAILVAKLKGMLEKYNATGYVCGHDHCLEHIDEGKGPKYVLTGAGKECCYSPDKAKDCPKNSIKFIAAKGFNMQSGFGSFEVSADQLIVKYYDQSGKILYQPPPMLPRSRAQ